MAKRSVLVTGVGKETGIGFEVCRQMAEHGFHVYLTARELSAAHSLTTKLLASGHEVTALELIVTDPDSVRNVAQTIPSLDILINNAGMLGPTNEGPLTADLEDAHDVFEVNFFGPWRMIQEFLPALQRGLSPRIVNVSSGAGSDADPEFGLKTSVMGPSYGVSKAALNALTVRSAAELRELGILINAVCPGFTATFPGGKQMGARSVVDGAKSVVWAALIPDDGPSGGFFRDGQRIPW